MCECGALEHSRHHCTVLLCCAVLPYLVKAAQACWLAVAPELGLPALGGEGLVHTPGSIAQHSTAPLDPRQATQCAGGDMFLYTAHSPTLPPCSCLLSALPHLNLLVKVLPAVPAIFCTPARCCAQRERGFSRSRWCCRHGAEPAGLTAAAGVSEA